MSMTMASIREEMKSCHGIDVVFAGKSNGVSVYRVFAKTFALNSVEYTKAELVKKWQLQ